MGVSARTIVVATFLTVACGILAISLRGSVTLASPATTQAVSMTQTLRFDPDPITITVGTTVIWTNTSTNISHTTTSDTSGIWNSGTVAPGGSFSFTFNTPGTFNYHCNFHRTQGMIGSITVVDLPTSTPTDTATSTSTPTPRDTATITPTPTITSTASRTPRPTLTRAPTNTRTPTVTRTPTATRTPRATLTRTPTSTRTPTQTRTPRPTPTRVPTNTPTPGALDAAETGA